MNITTKLSAIICALSCFFAVSVPLISEAENRKSDVLQNVVATEENSDNLFVSTSPETTPPPKTPVPEDTSPPELKPIPEKNMTVGVFLHKENKTVEMSLEDYIICVVAAEMPYTFNTEALKAQAVAARTYCIHKINSGNSHDSGADVCSDYAHCAAFTTEAELKDKYGNKIAERIMSKISNAVKETEGQIMTYNGSAILAVFHSRSYKNTESSENVWGGRLPYLVSVPTPEEDSISNVNITNERLTQLFSSEDSVTVNTNYEKNTLSSILNDSGRQSSLVFNGRTIKAKLMRSVFGFRSTSFEYKKTADGWEFTVHGYGHGVGMSQYGANQMAIDGSTYDQILKHYYTGITIESLK